MSEELRVDEMCSEFVGTDLGKLYVSTLQDMYAEKLKSAKLAKDVHERSLALEQAVGIEKAYEWLLKRARAHEARSL